jgi:hypothetical protein
MVHAMATDCGKLPRVAWFRRIRHALGSRALTASAAIVGIASLATLAACGVRVKPDTPFPEEPVMRKERAPAVAPHASGRQVVVGELCPKTADGRAGIAPLLMRSVQWTADATDVLNAVERGATPRYTVFGTDGKSAGVFDAVGVADVAGSQSLATGTYVGSAPCSSDAGQAQRTEDAACVAATGGCGLAVAELTRPDDPPEIPQFQTAGVCLSATALGVDIDGDGVPEWFPLSGVLDGTRGPAQEWTAGPIVKGQCDARFTAYEVKLSPETEAGKATDPRATVTLDVLGVVDLDGDGRKELVLALRFPTVRTIVIYSASGNPQRLDLVGEAQSFQPGQH